MLNVVFAGGAYGRDVSEADWQLGKDFKMLPSGPYFSIRDRTALIQDMYTEVVFYNSDSTKREFSFKL